MSSLIIIDEFSPIEENLSSGENKFKRLLKKKYIEPESPQKFSQYSVDSNIDKPNCHNEQSNEILEISNKNETKENLPKPAKKTIKKPRNLKKTVKEPKTPENTKKFISVFEDSDSANKLGESTNEKINKSPEKKPKRKPKKKTEDFELIIDANALDSHNSQNISQENIIQISEPISKKEKKVKLLRVKKKNERKNEKSSEKDEIKVLLEETSEKNNIDSASSDNDNNHKLSRLKRRSNKNREILLLEENPLENNETSLKKLKKATKPKKSNNENKEDEKIKKVEKVKKKTETTQEIFERMKNDPMFLCEEEEYDNRPEVSLDNNNQYFGLKKELKKRPNVKNHLVIKTRNKFFKEINMEYNPLNDDAPNNEEENEEISPNDDQLLLDYMKKPKQKIDMHAFLGKFQKFKEERALNINIQPNNNSNFNINTNIIKEPETITNDNNRLENNEEENNKENESVLPRQGDLLINEPLIEASLKNASNLVENQENYDKNAKKNYGNLKSTSHELNQFLNSTFSNFSIDEASNLSLQISIPTLNKMNNGNITDTTLFVNKLARSNSFLNKSLLSLGGFYSQNTLVNAGPNGINNNNMTSRDNYKSRLMDEIRKRKSKHLNLKDIQERFKQTDWNELTIEKQRNHEKKELDQNKDDEENDSDYNPEENIQKKEVQEKKEMDYKKMIELEEGVQENNDDSDDKSENEEENAKNEPENTPEEIQKPEIKERKQEQIQPNNEINLENSSQNTIEKAQTNENERLTTFDSTYVKKTDIIQEEPEENILDLEEDKEIRTLKKLRKIAENSVINYEEEKKKRKAERKARYEARMNDPNVKKMMQNLFEMEAELGSDNEENDNNVKRINRNDNEERESDEEMDEELKEMIDNITTEKEGEGDLLWNKFHEDIMKQDKENLKKVLERAFRKRKSDAFDIGDENGVSKV